MDKKGFDIIDEAYQKDLEKIRAKIEQEVREDKKYKGFKFSQNEADWKLAKHPYSFEEKKRAAENHRIALAAKEAKIQAEIEARLEEPRGILGKNHFGDLSRQQALENAMREEKIQDFKNQKRRTERLKQQRIKSIQQQQAQKEKAKTVIQQQGKSISTHQDNTKPKLPLDVKRDFQEANKAALAQQVREQKIQTFKARKRREEEQKRNRVQSRSVGKDRKNLNKSIVQKQFKNHTAEQSNEPQNPPKSPQRVGKEFNTHAEPPEPDNSLSAKFKEKSRDYDAEAKADKIAREEAFKARKREEFDRNTIEPDSGYGMD